MVLVAKNPLPVQETWETWVWSLGWEDPVEEGLAAHSSILPGESHRHGILAHYGPQGQEELDTTEAT